MKFRNSVFLLSMIFLFSLSESVWAQTTVKRSSRKTKTVTTTKSKTTKTIKTDADYSTDEESSSAATTSKTTTTSSGGEDTEVEALYDRLDDAAEKQNEKRKQEVEGKRVIPDKKEFEQLSDLAELSPYDDIAVISRKFLPKSRRFELAFIPTFSTNNAFYTNIGATGSLTYYLSEKWGVEGAYIILTDSKKDITKNLESKANVETRSLVNPRSFAGGWIKWAPIYGKLSWLEKTIVPYDMYFKLGAGMTATAESSSEATISAGAGQIFARSKRFAFRWDLLFNLYQATVEDDLGNKKKTSHNDLFLGVGVSFFFPDARYR